MPPAETGIRGHLLIRVEEASGKTNNDQFTWDTSSSTTFEAFVKVEIRGGAHNIKAQSSKAPLIGETITWRENLKLEVQEGANELRIMLCREKYQGTKKGTSVIAACGIYVNDIVDAAPIDKYFELFKPNAGGDGGFVRICMDFAKDAEELERKGHPATVSIPEDSALGQVAPVKSDEKPKKKGRKVMRLLLPVLALLAAGGAAAGMANRRKQKRDDESYLLER